MPQVTERRQPSGSVGPRGMERTRIFDVEAANFDDARDILRTQRGVEEGVAFTDPQGNLADPLCVCINIAGRARVEAVSGGIGLYEVQCDYGYQDYRGRLVSLPSGIRRDYLRIDKIQTIADVDRFGNAIQTRAGQVFSPPATKLVRQLVLEWDWITTGSSQLDVANRYAPFFLTLNNTTFRGYARGGVLCTDLRVDPIGGGGSSVINPTQFRVYMAFAFRQPKDLPGAPVGGFQGWTETKLHRGTMVLSVAGGGGRPITIREDMLDPNSPPIREPVNLTPNGTDPLLPVDATPNYLDFQLYDYTEFNSIPL